MDIAHLKQVSQTALPIYTQTQVEAALDQMAQNISADFQDKNPLVLCVVIGGIVTFGQLITRMQFPLQIDYVHASRYRGNTTGKEVVWKAKPTISLQDRHIIVVDDILDGGITLNDIKSFCLQNHAQSVSTAVLLDKVNCRLDDGLKHADYVGLSLTEDHYVFGYGLDYKTYLRNAPGIYAVEPSMLKKNDDLVVTD